MGGESHALIGGSAALKPTRARSTVSAGGAGRPGTRLRQTPPVPHGRRTPALPPATGVKFEWRGWRILPQICYDLRFGLGALSAGLRSGAIRRQAGAAQSPLANAAGGAGD
ncbi:hypothetical protein M8494_22300 [Serratia ureilytica]